MVSYPQALTLAYQQLPHHQQAYHNSQVHSALDPTFAVADHRALRRYLREVVADESLECLNERKPVSSPVLQELFAAFVPDDPSTASLGNSIDDATLRVFKQCYFGSADMA